VRIGAPWWFLDAPLAMHRFREATLETAGLYNTAGFVDDTRAFCSIPARHDVARRVDCGFLASLVARGLLAEDEAVQTAVDLTYTLPKQAFRV
jgi:glucuronate isomerase